MMSLWPFGRRKKLLQAPFPDDWEQLLATNCRHFVDLPRDKQARLRNAIKVIVGERTWNGVDGLALTDEIKVTVAAQAALLLLGVDDYYFDRVHAIVIHPRLFANRTTNADLHSRFQQTIPVLGEAHQQGSVVLVWQEVLAGARGHSGGSNLVLHEFAHHLDSLDGDMAGMPPQPNRAAERRWQSVVDAEYAQLVAEVEQGQFTLLGEYATINKAEFFAVATERFYELPHAMQHAHADLYQILCDFYRVDPGRWWADVAG